MAAATTAATAAGKTADTAARAIRAADRRTAASPVSIPEERLTREDEQQQPYLSDQEYPAYSEKDYEEYVDFPQSMLEPKYSSYQTV